MKNTIPNFFFLAVVAAFMAFTNPGKADYDDYLARYLAEQACKQDQLTNELKIACQGFTPIVAKPLLAHYSQRKNFILFSLYNTNIGEMKYRSIAIANNFVRF